MAELELGEGYHKEDEERGLKPWEQHSAVISIPRYDYKAPRSFMERPHSGFLVTCPIKREKSATREAISILEEHMGFDCTNVFERFEPCSKNVVPKRRKTCFQDADNLDKAEKNTLSYLSADSSEVSEVASLPPFADENSKISPSLSLVKLTKSGLILFSLPSLNYRVIDTVSNIFRSLGSGNQEAPNWCHRIFPIQETCCLIEKDLHAVVTNLVRWYFASQHDKPERSIKFAVGYNRRGGIEDTQFKDQKCNSAMALMERNKCFSIVARAFKDVVENSVVDLKTPEVVILVELLPLSGIPLESLMVGVSVLPCEFALTKPRLCMKPLPMIRKLDK